ncbi:MAG: metallophosphoesterase [Fusobacteriaceae bacterium]
MKILIISDSHGSLSNLIEIYEKENPDKIYVAGDFLDDIDEFKYIYPQIEILSVLGNCDFFKKNLKEELFFIIEGKKIFITHGHKYEVKVGNKKLISKAEELEADIIIYGHTHKKELQEINKKIYLNPGAVIDGNYGIINFFKDKIEFKQKKLTSNKCIDTKIIKL